MGKKHGSIRVTVTTVVDVNLDHWATEGSDNLDPDAAADWIHTLLMEGDTHLAFEIANLVKSNATHEKLPD